MDAKKTLLAWRAQILCARAQSESGQVAILFALVFTFLFILFAFVVDFSQVVNNAINLQLAADAAAYAGAAWQGRVLDSMGQVNYHMRQDLKEFAMRVNVTHVRHNRGFPRGSQYFNGQPQEATNLEPFICQQAHGYRAISGLQYAEDTNLCRNADPRVGGLPPIVVPPVIAAFDPFVVAISAQIRRIQQAANQECRAAAGDNRVLAEHLVNVYSSRAQFHSQQMQGLADFLNQVASQGPVNQSATQIANPLVQTAFQSALRNLTLSNRQNVTMEILQPANGQYVNLVPAQLNGSLFYINFNVEGNGCVGLPGVLDFNGLNAWFYKDSNAMTYFAVKLTSQPQMLFMPSPWVSALFPQFVAYAAAKPFGSRIGPQTDADPLAPVAARIGNNNRLVNFSFFPNDTLGMRSTKILAYFDALHPFNNLGRPDGNQNTGWPDPAKPANIAEALQAIRAPSLFDAAFFTIFPDPASSNTGTDYGPNAAYANALFPDYLEAASANNQILETPTPRTPPYFPSDVGSTNRGTGWIQVNANPSGRQDPYSGYAEEAPASHSTTSAVGLPLIGGAGAANAFGLADPTALQSGYTPLPANPVFGYSVKFLSFNALISNFDVQDQSSGNLNINNLPQGDPNLSRIYH